MPESDSFFQQTYTRRGVLLKFAELAGATAFLSACGPSAQSSKEVPVTPTVVPTATPAFVDRPGWRFSRLYYRSEPKHWFPLSEAVAKESGITTPYAKGGPAETYDLIHYQLTGERINTRDQVAALAPQFRNDRGAGYCAHVARAGLVFKDPRMDVTEIKKYKVDPITRLWTMAAYTGEGAKVIVKPENAWSNFQREDPFNRPIPVAKASINGAIWSLIVVGMEDKWNGLNTKFKGVGFGKDGEYPLSIVEFLHFPSLQTALPNVMDLDAPLRVKGMDRNVVNRIVFAAS